MARKTRPKPFTAGWWRAIEGHLYEVEILMEQARLEMGVLREAKRAGGRA